MQAGWHQPRGYAIQVTLPNVGMTR
jgi:hypothetical protein